MTTGVNRLKELLFDTEAQRLDEVARRIDVLSTTETARHEEVARRQGELQRRVDAVFERAGTEDRLQKSVASILDGALRDAEVTKHEQLSQAVAPLVVRTIKYELKNSQDEMVDALYPLTGRLVAQYVQSAMNKVMADINSKLGGRAPSELEARAKDLGLTVPELVLAETQQLKIDELFLVRRGSGELVAHWEPPLDGGTGVPTAAGANRDVLIAGYLSGITAFSEEAFDDKKGVLRSLDMQGERIFVRASPAYLLAARCSGSAPQSVEQIIDDEFVRVLADFKQTPGAAGDGLPVDGLMPTLATSFEQRFEIERRKIEEGASRAGKGAGRGRLYAFAALFLLPLLGWYVWSAYQSWQAARVLSEARSLLVATSELRGYPVTMDVGTGGRVLTVGGLTPTEATRTAFLGSLRQILPGTIVQDATAVIPRPLALATGPDLTGEIESLKRQLDAARQQAADATTRLAALTSQVAPVSGQLTVLQSQLPDLQGRTVSLDEHIRRLDQRIDGLPKPQAAVAAPPPPSPRDVLEAYARAHAVFFANGVDFVDELRTAETLDRLALLIQGSDVLVRVVGYTDERGPVGTNAQLAQSRAERVAQMLYGRGVPRERIGVIGRTSGQELSRNTGPGSPNRRVAFELGYVGEPAQ